MVIQRESLSILTSDGENEIMRFDPSLGTDGKWLVFVNPAHEELAELIDACNRAWEWGEKRKEAGNGNP